MATHATITTLPAAHPGSLRARMERAVEEMLAAAERLIAEIDAMDPDPDLEDGADGEHTLGRSEALDQTKPNYPADDLEPSLGAANPMPWTDQTAWGHAWGDWPLQDFEEQCEDEGIDTDSELESAGTAIVPWEGSRIDGVMSPFGGA